MTSMFVRLARIITIALLASIAMGPSSALGWGMFPVETGRPDLIRCAEPLQAPVVAPVLGCAAALSAAARALSEGAVPVAMSFRYGIPCDAEGLCAVATRNAGYVVLWFGSGGPSMVPVALKDGVVTTTVPEPVLPLDVADVRCVDEGKGFAQLGCEHAAATAAAALPAASGPYLAVEVRQGPPCAAGDACPRPIGPESFAVFRFVDGSSRLIPVILDETSGVVTAGAIQPCRPAVCDPPDTDQPISVRNDTDRAIVIWLDGSVLDTLDPGNALTTGVPLHPEIPWTIEARTTDGTILGTLVLAGSAPTAGTLDLICGRISVWAGVMFDSPTDAPGTPGDC